MKNSITNKMILPLAVASAMLLGGCSGSSDSTDSGGLNPGAEEKLMGTWLTNCDGFTSGSKRLIYVFDGTNMREEIHSFNSATCDEDTLTDIASESYKYTVGDDTYGADDAHAYELDLTFNYTTTTFTMFRFTPEGYLSLITVASDAGEGEDERDGSTAEKRLNDFSESRTMVSKEDYDEATAPDDEEDTEDGSGEEG